MVQEQGNQDAVCEETGHMIAANPCTTQFTNQLATGLRFSLFGTPEIVQNGAFLRRTRTRTELWLLTLLVLYKDRDVQRSWLAGTFWPDSDESQALNNLRRSLSNLRSVLGQDADKILAPTRGSLRFDFSGVWCDVHAFDAAISRGDTRSLDEAIVLYRGSLLKTCDEDWVRSERVTREQRYLEALESLAGYESAAGRPDRAAELLNRVLVVEPGREPALIRLLEALRDAGNQPAMIQAYRAFRLYLHNELRSEPAPETSALFQRLRSTPKAASSAPDSPLALTAPVPVDSAMRRNLPTALTQFYGREQECDQLTRMVEHPGIHLVTLTGMGGGGKTRLALEVGHRIQQTAVKPVWFISLAETSASDLIFDAIRNGLSIAPAAVSDDFSQVITVLQGEPALLILDNFEHLIDTGAHLIRSLLERVPTLTIMATSRRPIGLAGEQEFEISPLATPRGSAHPNRLLEFASVQLFVDRAKTRRFDFELTVQNAAAVAALCERLDGLPLAIELAAGWAKVLTPQQMIEELKHRFEFLVSTRTDLPERHRTLRAVLDASFGLLSPELQQFLAMLTVFRGGWTLQAAQAVCREPEALGMLFLLRERSLILTAENMDSEESPRFLMLESLRDYAADQLVEQTRNEIARWHADFYVALVQEANTHLKGADQSLWLKRLEAENDNLRAALAWTLEYAPETALLLSLLMNRFWQMRGYYAEGRRWIKQALTHCVDGAPLQRARVLDAAGQLAMCQGDYTQAHAYYEEGLILFKSLGNQRGISAMLNNIGIVARNQNDFATARRYYEESMHIDEALNDHWGVAASLNNMGNMALIEQDYQTARTLHERSLQIRRELGDRDSVAWSLSNLGNVFTHLGDYTPASQCYHECLTITRELGDKKGTILGLGGLVMVAGCMQDDVAFRRWLTEMVGLVLEIEDKHCACIALAHCASLLSRTAPRVESAIRLLSAATALSNALSAPFDPKEQKEMDVLLVRFHSATTPAEFASEWAAGEHMTWREALEYALAQLSETRF